jgi:hypothetical protein
MRPTLWLSLMLGILVIAGNLPQSAHAALPHHAARSSHLRSVSRVPLRSATQPLSPHRAASTSVLTPFMRLVGTVQERVLLPLISRAPDGDRSRAPPLLGREMTDSPAR